MAYGTTDRNAQIRDQHFVFPIAAKSILIPFELTINLDNQQRRHE